ncbi:TVP38/TMEM64 family protein [Ornithinimicrobium sediminis]|uniref:TVP38/TMEM64 family protein n=1 Tax=Ornithinimicrobium sediminis TaxID=2904603 RepID=UPI001E447565|nr:TVP38/TMEM64 family protein [Ornithinimicrobium sediminis]MCE0486547.1 TVP38/TMEM64 family protein [Ornithinimicrobium sediminis]
MTTCPRDDAESEPGASRGLMVRAALLVVLLAAAAAAAWTVGSPDVARLRAQVDAAGLWAPAVFVAGYALWSLLPVPKNVVTVLAGGLFGFLSGAMLAWLGAMLGAVAAFGVARWLGRDGVDALLRGRLRQVDARLRDRGLVALLTVRLVPVLPFTVINYGAGVTGVTLRDYVLGTALGMLPGTLAYAAIGAFGVTRPWAVWVAAGVLVVLVVVGGGLARRGAGRASSAPTGPSGPERDDV